MRWEWKPHDVSIEVTVDAIEPNRLVRIEWPGYSVLTEVEDVPGDPRRNHLCPSRNLAGLATATSSCATPPLTQGFTLMLAGLKAFLEHDIQLNLTLDRYPEGI